ncbi:hypothetical protein G5V58_20575 [Nocardioides anomalus]|uniref:Uncharacterized protein n=1 Tax=Nocardioides anomalus TaxID=2712223 RepID=A0A6G6WID8_9ACTN|nr:hypothetical protein [Nocardioides anomalus]QIG44855.1 hypothetical protein G5V58_20575 [Nocardioides anomalus]
MPQDPMATARAVQAVMAQASAWVAQYRADLAARGLGFGPDDLAAITAAAQAHPTPPPSADPAADAAEAQRVQQLALSAEYPEGGFAPTDPRLAAVGMPLVSWAMAARAVGWATSDEALVERVLRALGHTRADHDTATAHWTAVLKQDMAVATLYGQLFTHCAPLPTRPA